MNIRDLAAKFPDWDKPEPAPGTAPKRIRLHLKRRPVGRPRIKELTEAEAGREPICEPALERLRARKRKWYHDNKARRMAREAEAARLNGA